MERVFVALCLVAGCGDPVCPGAQIACGGTCIDPKLDPANCGACDRGCQVDEVCSVATCAKTCLAALSDCDGRCVDETTDIAHCGACGTACAAGEVCSGGQCTSACGASLSRCADRCADVRTDEYNCGTCGNACGPGQLCAAGTCTTSNIQHVVLIVEENHTFDNYFGAYCRAPAGSHPTCETGPDCCEAAPATEPSGSPPIALDDASNQAKDRDHERVCEVAQIDNGAMDHYVVGSGVTIDPIAGLYTYDCSDPHNFAVADQATAQPYWTYAAQGALADRYFQPMVGSTSGNDMYLATAQWEFDDNNNRPFTIGSGCLGPGGNAGEIPGVTVADLLVNNGFSFRMYADGYADAVAAKPACASVVGQFPPDCEDFERTARFSTCNYDPADLPFEYFLEFADNPDHLVDFTAFAQDLAANKLPSFAYIKARTYRNEHPRWSTLARGMAFVSGVVAAIESSAYADTTLILLVWDEGGGFYDHVPPPPALAASIDADSAGQPVPYGTRVPMLAIGHFAAANKISHVVMEHSSVVRLLEHNFLGPRYAGALGHRDAAIANLGSLLDPATTGIAIP